MALVIPLLTIASLNIASSGRDEITNPLFKRLPHVLKLIKEQQFANKYSILCIQEIRPSGSESEALSALSALDITLAIKNTLGPNWNFLDHKINPSDGAFHRTIFWDSTLFSHHSTNYTYADNTINPEFPNMFTKTHFALANAKNNNPIFNVINGHAPVAKNDRIAYWKIVRDFMDDSTIIVGDFNKFENEQSQYDQIFSDDVKDLIEPGVLTFVSFNADRKTNGELWYSSLDACIVNHKYYYRSNVVIVSTENEPRPTDHFMIMCSVSLDSKYKLKLFDEL